MQLFIIQMKKQISLIGLWMAFTLLPQTVSGQETEPLPPNDSTINAGEERPRFLHRIEADGRFAYIFPTNSFLKGYNNQRLIMHYAASYHLKYAFQFPENSSNKDTYQGVGLSYYDFGNPKGLGNPMVFYLYQGAPIVHISNRLSFNYEWNFGISCGWKPYNKETNPDNKLIGSKVNAYLNANFYLNWRMARHFDFNIGIEGTHFSNGNTRYPNLGLNTAGIRAGLVYYFDRSDWKVTPAKKIISKEDNSSFKERISYDMLLFGSWRRTGVTFHDGLYLAPKAYPVIGFSFSPMYRLGQRFKTGLSLDGVYDGGSRIQGVERNELVPYTGSESDDYDFDIVKPPFYKQLSLGLSTRGEFVMPYFSINFGLGANFLNSNKDLKFFYQMLNLKIDLFKDLYLNIGYNLRNFQEPNYLMLGVGYRFHNKK